jgi:hypothetical protein
MPIFAASKGILKDDLFCTDRARIHPAHSRHRRRSGGAHNGLPHSRVPSASRPGPAAALGLDQLLAALPEATRTARNPWAWRTRVQHHGPLQEVGILPDYVFAILFPDGKRRAFVVECDRGTMPVGGRGLQPIGEHRLRAAYAARASRVVPWLWRCFNYLIFEAIRASACRTAAGDPTNEIGALCAARPASVEKVA